MLDKNHTSYDRKMRHVLRNLDGTVHEDTWVKDRVYVPVEEVLSRVILDAIADYSLCNQWD